MKLTAYLNFDGQAEAAIGFYKDLFDARVSSLMRFSDAPAEMDFPQEMASKIMHCSLDFAGGAFQLSDSLQDEVVMGNAIYLSVAAESSAEAHALFAGLSSGGEVIMALGEVFWGGIFGMTRDKFGVQWMVSAP